MQAEVSAYEPVQGGAERGAARRNALYIARRGWLLGVWRAVVWHPLLPPTRKVLVRQVPLVLALPSLSGGPSSVFGADCAGEPHRQRGPKKRRFAQRLLVADQPAAILLIARL